MNTMKVQRHKNSIFCLSFTILFMASDAMAEAYYFHSGFSTIFPRQDVSTNAGFAPICTDNNGLPGLDLVRSYLGFASCPDNSNERSLGSHEIHVVFLVNDSRPMSQYMINALGEKNLLRNHRGRQIVDSGVRNFTQEGEFSNLNVLTVGEMDYRIAGSDSAWWNKMTQLTGHGLTNEQCGLSPQDVAAIEGFSDNTITMNQDIKSTLNGALGNFTRNMSFDSSYQAQARVANALAEEAISQARSYVVGKIAAQVPGFDLFVSFYDAANSEIARAAAAGRSYRMSEWIQNIQRIITDCVGTTGCNTGGSDEVQVLTSEYVVGELTDRICSLPENRRATARDSLLEAASQMTSSRPVQLAFEKGLYESWINSHYQAAVMDSDSAQGTIEVVWEVEENGGVLDLDEESYIAMVNVTEYGDDADDALNTIIDGLRSVSKPLDFKVKKKICFIVDNVNPGGRSRECALLDIDNRVLQRVVGSTDMAERAFLTNQWREHTTRFIRRN